jgi:hypothetical protein
MPISDGWVRAIKNPCSLLRNRGSSCFDGRHDPPLKQRRYAGFMYDYPTYKNSHPDVKKISCKDNQKGADNLMLTGNILNDANRKRRD